MTETACSILLVEDDPAVGRGIEYAFKLEGWQVDRAQSVEAAEEKFRNSNYDIAVLDIGLPDGTGFDLCKSWRETSDIPILILTARDLEIDKVMGLELGADDYVTKPFGVRELVARVKALHRRSKLRVSKPEMLQMQHDHIFVDLDRRTVKVKNKSVHLTYTEFEILRTLMSRSGFVFSREALLQKIWNDIDFMGGEKTIDVHIRNLRRKLDEAGDAGQMIETIRGVGYRWRDHHA